MRTPTHPDNPADTKAIAAFDRAQTDPRTLEQIARLERARAVGEALATAVAWLVRLPRRIVEAVRSRTPAGRHA
jgi:predicted oxidoreductase